MKNTALLMTIVLLASPILAEENNEEWLNKHAAIKTTETVEKDGNNNVKSMRIVKDTTVYIKQTATEIYKPDKNGDLKPISRTTISTDVLGSNTVVIESVSPEGIYITLSITTTEKTAEGLVTTVFSRNKFGSMVMTSKTTASIQSNSSAVITATM